MYVCMMYVYDLQQCLETWLRPFLRSVKAVLEISYSEEIQGEDILTTRASPREVEAGRGLWQKPEVYSYHRFGHVCRTVA